jgi:curved DNA-binding protein CbpA
MIPDPYKALNLPRTANGKEIKRSYHLLARQHHPDRYVSAAETERKAATNRFAKIAEAYEILSDSRRKEQYDHIYKYGGYGEEQEEKTDGASHLPRPRQKQYSRSGSATEGNSTGIGYTCAVPPPFLWKSGRAQTSISHCGVQIPSRRTKAQPNSFSFTFKTSLYTQSSSSGKQNYTSTTTQFVNGKKYFTSETTTIYPDGRKDVIVQGGDCTEHRCEHASTEHLSQANSMNQQEPWYIGAWHEIKVHLAMCYSPCTVAH